MNDEVDASPPATPRPPRLNQPWRALVALAELVVAAAAVWAAFPCWANGVKTLTSTFSNGIVLTSTRFVGSWMAGAIALGLVAAILLVDAVREVLLAVRFRGRRHRRRIANPGGIEGQQPHLSGS